MKERFIKYLCSEYRIFAVLLLVFSLIGYAGEFHFFFDLASHLKFQLFVGSIVFLFLYIFVRKIENLSKWFIIMLISSFLINTIEILPWINLRFSSEIKDSQGIKIALSNVLTKNNDYNAVLDFIKTEKPDILILQEVNQVWLDKMKVLKKNYPYDICVSREDNFGIALFSKIPVQNSKIEFWGDYEVPVILTETKIYNKKVRIAAIHTLPPWNQAYFKAREIQLSEISAWIRSSDIPAIVIGDLNTSMFSPSYKRMIKDSGLINSRKGYGIYPSWPAFYPEIFRVTLDQVLHTDNLKTTYFKTGSKTGSDHLPVVAKINVN